MPSLSYFPIQKAIYEKLTGNSPLMALINGIFDHIPQGTSFPYVTIDEVSASDFSNLNKNGVEHDLVINIWSREAGHKQAANIMEAIYVLLHNGTITVTGKTLLDIKITTTSLQRENDGWTYHGRMQLKILLIDN